MTVLVYCWLNSGFHKTFITIFSHLNKRDYFAYTWYSQCSHYAIETNAAIWAHELNSERSKRMNIFSVHSFLEMKSFLKKKRNNLIFSAHATAIVFVCVNYGLKTIAIIIIEILFCLFHFVLVDSICTLYTRLCPFSVECLIFLVFWSIISFFLLCVQWHLC